MRRLFGLCVLLALCATLGGPVPAAHWSRFRGPNGTGIAVDQDIPVRWSDGDGLLWKVPLPGVGNSSPVVWGERIFLQSAKEDGSTRLLLCLNAADGKVLWSRAVPGARARTHPKNTLATSTPATDGERVYAVFWDGRTIKLSAYDFQGQMVWERDLGTFTSQHGAGASPIVHDGKVFLANDQDGASTLVALDARTGKTVWEAPRTPFRTCYSTPFVLERPGEVPTLVVASTAGLTGYDPTSGTVRWDWKWVFDGMALRTVGSPVYSQGLVIATSGDGGGARHTVAVQVDGKGNGAGPHLVWEKKRDMPYVPTLLAWGEHLYFVTDRPGLAGCLVARTGEVVWSERLGGTFSASPILIDGKVYAVNEDGTVHVFAAAPTFQRLATNTLGEGVVATPAVAEHRLFFRGKQHLFCIGKRKEG